MTNIIRRGQEITTEPWVHLVVKSVRECCHQHWEITDSRRSRFTLPLALEIIMWSEEVRKSPLALGKIVWPKVLRMLSPTLGNLGSRRSQLLNRWLWSEMSGVKRSGNHHWSWEQLCGQRCLGILSPTLGTYRQLK